MTPNCPLSHIISFFIATSLSAGTRHCPMLWPRFSGHSLGSWGISISTIAPTAITVGEGRNGETTPAIISFSLERDSCHDCWLCTSQKYPHVGVHFGSGSYFFLNLEVEQKGVWVRLEISPVLRNRIVLCKTCCHSFCHIPGTHRLPSTPG